MKSCSAAVVAAAAAAAPVTIGLPEAVAKAAQAQFRRAPIAI
jgi:hypothetical protein